MLVPLKGPCTVHHLTFHRLRFLCCLERNPPIEEVIKTGVIPKFVEFLQRGDAPQLQVRHAWQSLCSGSKAGVWCA